MRSKIHKATITEANPDYVGSITIDEDLIERVGLWHNERVSDRQQYDRRQAGNLCHSGRAWFGEKSA